MRTGAMVSLVVGVLCLVVAVIFRLLGQEVPVVNSCPVSVMQLAQNLFLVAIALVLLEKK